MEESSDLEEFKDDESSGIIYISVDCFDLHPHRVILIIATNIKVNEQVRI